jgi:hypothetical protein
MDDGILVGKNKIIVNFQVRAFCADAPARAYITCSKYHNAFNGCSKCNQEGYQISKTTVYQNRAGSPRTDETFQNRLDPKHHSLTHVRKPSVMEKIGFDMVSQVPIDSMHLIDQGVTKKSSKLCLRTEGKCFLKMTI